MRVGQTRRRDANEAAIVAALRKIGVQVWRISAPGLPDLITHHRWTWRPLEIKRPGGSLTPAQRETFRTAPFAVVSSVIEAVRLFGVGE